MEIVPCSRYRSHSVLTLLICTGRRLLVGFAAPGAASGLGATVTAAAAGHQIEASETLGYVAYEVLLLAMAEAALVDQRTEQIDAQIQIAFGRRARRTGGGGGT